MTGLCRWSSGFVLLISLIEIITSNYRQTFKDKDKESYVFNSFHIIKSLHVTQILKSSILLWNSIVTCHFPNIKMRDKKESVSSIKRDLLLTEYLSIIKLFWDLNEIVWAVLHSYFSLYSFILNKTILLKINALKIQWSET